MPASRVCRGRGRPPCSAPNLPPLLVADAAPPLWTAPACSTLEHLLVTSPDSIILTGDLSYADGFQPRW